MKDAQLDAIKKWRKTNTGEFNEAVIEKAAKEASRKEKPGEKGKRPLKKYLISFSTNNFSELIHVVLRRMQNTDLVGKNREKREIILIRLQK